MTADQQPPEPPAPTPDEALLTGLLPRLGQLSTLMNRGRFTELAMEGAGLSLDRPAMTILLTLHLAGRPLRVGEIATRMQVVGPHITRQVNVLEKRGLVGRVTDPQDSRARLIEATPEGVAAARRYMGVLLGWFTDALADWSEEDRQDLGRLLARFADDFAAHLRDLETEGGG